MNGNPINAERAEQYVESFFGESTHLKRVQSLSNAMVGAMRAGVYGTHAIGHGLAKAAGLKDKHAIKQVDRLLGNPAIDPWGLFADWVPHIVGARMQIIVAMDWTEFDADDQSAICIYLVTKHGRATPLVWKTVVKSELKGWRNAHEDAVILRLAEVLPAGVKVTVLADRGFGDKKLYELLGELNFDYVVRFREGIRVTDAKGVAQPASRWVPRNGRRKLLRRAKVTAANYEVPSVVCVKAKGMKDAWCLAAGSETATAGEIVDLYGRRFTIEETFRDTKDLRFGMGMSATHIGTPERRDRMLLISALTTVLLTLLGAAGEALGMDRMLKADTSKKRTHSLFTQGWHYYGAIPEMPADRLAPLIERFGQFIQDLPVCRVVFGLV
jgi:hypothetical protein